MTIPILKWKQVQLFDLISTPVIYFEPTIVVLEFIQDFGAQNIPIYIEGTGIYDGCNRGNIDQVNDRPCEGSNPSQRPMFCFYLKRSFETYPSKGSYGKFRLPDLDSENKFFFPNVNAVQHEPDEINVLRQEDDVLEPFQTEAHNEQNGVIENLRFNNPSIKKKFQYGKFQIPSSFKFPKSSMNSPHYYIGYIVSALLIVLIIASISHIMSLSTITKK